MAIEQHSDEALAPDDVRRALDAMLASETFRASPQLAAFLRFIVEASLRGESDRIKGYTIGVEALGRDASFDPQIDPIVRVEATRLRRTLDRYYAGPGAADSIVFSMSRGSYIPAIRRRALGDGRTTIDLRARSPNARVWLAALAAAALIIVVTVVLAMRNRDAEAPRSNVTERASDQTFDGPLQPGNGKPTIAITHVTILGLASQPGAARQPITLSGPFVEKLRAALVRFDTVNVRSDADEPSRDAAKPALGSNYQLIGSGELQEQGTVHVRFRLVDLGDGTAIWSRSFGPFAMTTDYTPIEDAIVRQLAMTLAPPFGVIRANERRKHLAGVVADPRYRCIVETSESFRSFDPAQHMRARGCLELLTAKDPSFAMGFAYLASVYAREYQYRLGPAANDTAILDRALQAARHAVELSPESARAYQMLATVLFARRDLAGAFAAGDRAIALNPLDMTIRTDYGGRLIVAGEIDRGMAIVTEAAETGAVRPTWHQFYLFLGSYLKNDMAAATGHAGQIASETYPLGLLAQALSAAANGNRDEARKAFERLVAAHPAWRNGAREELARIFPVPAVSDRLADDLAKGGLTGG